MMLHMLSIILYQSLLIFPLILGGFYTIVLMRLPDLALEAAFLTGATISMLVMAFLPKDMGHLPALCFILFSSALAGSSVGFITSILREKLQISHLFASIISIGFFTSLSRFMLGAPHVSLLVYPSYLDLQLLPDSLIKPELASLIVIAILLAVAHRFLLKTQLGLAVEIYGVNRLFFKFHRLKESFIAYTGTTLAHSLAGISGYLVSQSHGFVDTSLGSGIGLQVITALLFGVICSERLGFARTYQALAGVCCYFTLHGLLLISGFDLTYFTGLQAVAVAICCFYRRIYLSAPSEKVKTYGFGV